MSISAIILMVLAMVCIWGGLIVSILHSLRRH